MGAALRSQGQPIANQPGGGQSWAGFLQLRRMYGAAYNNGREVGFKDPDRRRKLAGLRLEGGWTCLDVGCGRGGLVEQLRARGVLASGIDLGEDVRTPTGCVGNAIALPFRTGAFDAIVACDLVEHVPLDWQAELARELTRVGRGLLLVTVPTLPPHFWLGSAAGLRHHYLCQPPSHWRRHFGYHGFTILGEGEELASLGPPFDHGADNYPFALGRSA